jgi:hypothetical protein
LVSFFFTNPWPLSKKYFSNKAEFAAVISNAKPYRRLDFSANNQELLQRDFSETAVFSKYIFEEMLSGNTFTGIGGYDEDRVIYRHRKHFTRRRKIRGAFTSVPTSGLTRARLFMHL